MTEELNPDELTALDAIRKRPAMYVGSLGFFGLVNYLVCPVSLLLAHGARQIHATVTDDGFRLESDATLKVEEAGDGRIVPFENLDRSGGGTTFDGCVLNALSKTLVVRLAGPGAIRALEYRCGRRQSIERGGPPERATQLSFTPDSSIFSVTSLSPAIFESYLRRLSFLHAGVRFRLSYADQFREYFAAGGIRDLFESVSAPYQLMHTPIHFVSSEEDLRAEVVLSYHSWVENWVWCFINNGRAAEGGTHEKGFQDAIDKLYERFKGRRRPKRARNGVVAVVSIYYPHVVWEGCIKTRIGNPELREMVSRLVLTNVTSWVEGHPEVAQQLSQMEPFQFPDAWFR